MSITSKSTINNCHESRLGRSVRTGRCGSDPRMVPEFIRSHTLLTNNLDRAEQRQTQLEIISVLFETVADTLLAQCWRNWCLHCCAMPLHTLRCLSSGVEECAETEKLEEEMTVLKNYFL